MKKCLYIFLLLLCCTTLFGCDQNNTAIREPVNFYYCNSTITYNRDDGVISAEVRESAGHGEDIASLLQLYLQGPVSDAHIPLLPDAVTLEKCVAQEQQYQIYLSREFAEIQGLDQTLSGACLAKTVMELSSATTVTIYSDDLVLVFDEGSLLLMDDTQ